MLNQYLLSKKLINSPLISELASQEEFLNQWEILRSELDSPESINLQAFFSVLNRDIRAIISNVSVLKIESRPFYLDAWQDPKWVKVARKFEAVEWFIKIDKMAISQQDKLALSNFVLWIAKKYYSIKP